MGLRDMSVEALAADLDERAPKADESWERQVKSWRREDKPRALSKTNAELLGDALRGDFTSFVRQYATAAGASAPSWPEIRRLIREELEAAVVGIEERIVARLSRVPGQQSAPQPKPRGAKNKDGLAVCDDPALPLTSE